MTGKRMDSLVPNKTSWRLIKNCRKKPILSLEISLRSDFLRSEEDDMLWAVLPRLTSLLEPLRFPASRPWTSHVEPIAGMHVVQDHFWCISCMQALVCFCMPAWPAWNPFIPIKQELSSKLPISLQIRSWKALLRDEKYLALIVLWGTEWFI